MGSRPDRRVHGVLARVAIAGLLLLSGCARPSGPAVGDGLGDRERDRPGRWSAAPVAPGDAIRLDELQFVGTHNSYHQRPAAPVLERLAEFDPRLPPTLDYEHLPLAAQLDLGIRQVELDVFADPEGGLFATPAAERVAPTGEGAAPGLDAPGFKVLHIPDVDHRSSCATLVACLRAIEGWSAAHPDHLPIAVFLEPKESSLPDLLQLGFVTPQPITSDRLDELDAEIRSVFGPTRLLTPDDVRGTAATLREAVTTTGWPTLGDSRGRVLFCLLDGGTTRSRYVDGHPSLRGRAMFTTSGTNAPESAIVSRPDPRAAADDIAAVAAQGFLVRTRADVDTAEARAGDTRRADAARASGAHWISTDFPVPDPTLGNDYAVRFADGAYTRCNPASATPACRPNLGLL